MMWSSIMAPAGHNYSNSFVGTKQHQVREFGMLVPSLQIAPGKFFSNPNFVNNINKYQNNLKQHGDIPLSNSYKNSCHGHNIIDSIKEKCPEVIPSGEDNKNGVSEPPTEMEIYIHDDKKQTQKKRNRRPKQRKKAKQMSQKSNPTEMSQEVILADISNLSLGDWVGPAPHNLSLDDFLIKKSLLDVHMPLRKTDHIDIPTSKGTEILITNVSPVLKTHEYSVTDSEDSLVIFEGTERDKDDISECSEFLNSRRRLPSMCESEDSFIVFERDDQGNLEDAISYETSSEDSSYNKSDEGSSDETDMPFSIIDQKKVRFASADKLCQVHPMVQWSYAYQAARKGPWEMYARDRCRFRERLEQVEREIKHVFDPQHRDKIYKERFENFLCK